jgi:DDE superfamily endonuclease/Winged helix-turn helix
MPYRVPAALDLSEAERAELQRWARRRKAARALALRARVVLRAAAGLSNTAVAADLGVAEHTAGKWRERFARLRADGLLDEPRPGAPRRTDDERIAAPPDRTPAERPEGGTHRSLRSMAKASGLSAATVGRARRASGLRPHRAESFRLSTDPLSAEEVRDIVGLHLAPPDRAPVLCVDEKSRVQALDRTRPPLPLRPGQAERRAHDDRVRHGATGLFAALDVKAGAVIGRCFPRHRASESRRFLDEIDARVAPELDIHLVLGDAGTRRTKPIRDWLARRPRCHVHFTPTSASWIDQVERWFFGLLTGRAIRRGVHRSVGALERDIQASVDATDAGPKPFRWVKPADDILAGVKRFCLRSLGEDTAGHALSRTSEPRH